MFMMDGIAISARMAENCRWIEDVEVERKWVGDGRGRARVVLGQFVI